MLDPVFNFEIYACDKRLHNPTVSATETLNGQNHLSLSEEEGLSLQEANFSFEMFPPQHESGLICVKHQKIENSFYHLWRLSYGGNNACHRMTLKKVGLSPQENGKFAFEILPSQHECGLINSIEKSRAHFVIFEDSAMVEITHPTCRYSGDYASHTTTVK